MRGRAAVGRGSGAPSRAARRRPRSRAPGGPRPAARRAAPRTSARGRSRREVAPATVPRPVSWRSLSVPASSMIASGLPPVSRCSRRCTARRRLDVREAPDERREGRVVEPVDRGLRELRALHALRADGEQHRDRLALRGAVRRTRVPPPTPCPASARRRRRPAPGASPPPVRAARAPRRRRRRAHPAARRRSQRDLQRAPLRQRQRDGATEHRAQQLREAREGELGLGLDALRGQHQHVVGPVARVPAAMRSCRRPAPRGASGRRRCRGGRRRSSASMRARSVERPMSTAPMLRDFDRSDLGEIPEAKRRRWDDARGMPPALLLAALTLMLLLAPATAAAAPPTCGTASAEVEPDVPVDLMPFGAGECFDPDGGPLSLAIVDDPQHGTASVEPGAVGDVIVYDPDDGYVGEDSFTFRADDGVDAVRGGDLRDHGARAERPPQVRRREPRGRPRRGGAARSERHVLRSGR